jgi:hypothetical protein
MNICMSFTRVVADVLFLIEILWREGYVMKKFPARKI